MFRLLVQWFYVRTDEAFSRSPEQIQGYDAATFKYDKDKKALFDKHHLNLVKLWILADRLFMPVLQNQIIAELKLDLWPEFFTNHAACGDHCWLLTSWLHVAYSGTTTGSPLRQFAVDYYRHAAAHFPESMKTFEERISDFPQEMLFGVSKWFLWGKNNKPLYKDVSACKYFVPEV